MGTVENVSEVLILADLHSAEQLRRRPSSSSTTDTPPTSWTPPDGSRWSAPTLTSWQRPSGHWQLNRSHPWARQGRNSNSLQQSDEGQKCQNLPKIKRNFESEIIFGKNTVTKHKPQ